MRLRWLLLTALLLLLLVPAGALSCARLVGPDGGAWVRLVAFTPLATVLYGVAALLLVVARWRARGAGKGLARTGLVLCLVAVAVHAWLASGPYRGSDLAEADAGHDLRVMTANLELGQADAARVVEAAVAHGVDVLVLTELTPEELGRLDAAGRRTAYPHRAGAAQPGPKGTLVVSTRGLTDVHRLATGFGTWTMDVHAPGGRVHLVAVHARPPTGDAADWEADQGVVRHAAVAATGPTLLVGDFNATLDHQPLRELTARGFTDATIEARSGWQPTWPSAGEVRLLGVPVPSVLPLDHVLTSQHLHTRSTTSLTVAGTDHRALVAVVAR